MSKRSIPLLLEDMGEAAARIERYVGEAANRLPEDFTRRHADIPWPKIVGLRHRIVHDYFDIDLEIVWQIIQQELPPLKERLAKLRAEQG